MSSAPPPASPASASPKLPPVRAFLGLGSNIGDRVGHLRVAVAGLPDVVAVSDVYETEPVGGVDQDAFLNLVVELETVLSPEALLRRCQELEQQADRVREVRWGPRTLDVDVLLYGDQRIDTPDLIVPHPRMTERNFVMVPLLEVAVDLAGSPLLAGYDPDLAVGAVHRVGPLNGGPTQQNGS